MSEGGAPCQLAVWRAELLSNGPAKVAPQGVQGEEQRQGLEKSKQGLLFQARHWLLVEGPGGA